MPARVLEVRGGLVRIASGSGWLDAAALTPCKCGNTRFRQGRWRLFCPKCLKPKPGEPLGDTVDVLELRREVQRWLKNTPTGVTD